RTGALSPSEMTHTLTRLKAPPEALEDFTWNWRRDLFEAYTVRTPVRRDARDPLLLGRGGGSASQPALGGESVRRLEEITALVHESLALRARVARWRVWLGLGGTLAGLALIAWVGSRLGEDHPFGTSLAVTWGSMLLACLWMLLKTPENCQHDFLDRYRC